MDYGHLDKGRSLSHSNGVYRSFIRGLFLYVFTYSIHSSETVILNLILLNSTNAQPAIHTIHP